MTIANIIDNLIANNKPVWMGIVNITPDSFSDGGNFYEKNNALKQAELLIKNGAHIIDIGGVSTRPGSTPVSEIEEWERIYPTLLELNKQFQGQCLFSVDTFRPTIAAKLADNGLITIINDIYGGTFIENASPHVSTITVAATYGLGIVLMHMQGTPNTMQQNPTYNNCISDVCAFLHTQATLAKKLNVPFIAVDPGIGFGKTLQNNLDLLSQKGINLLKATNFPVLIGLSRKRFIAELYKSNTSIDLSVPHSRDFYTKEFETQAIAFGTDIIRTHVVLANTQPACQ